MKEIKGEIDDYKRRLHYSSPSNQFFKKIRHKISKYTEDLKNSTDHQDPKDISSGAVGDVHSTATKEGCVQGHGAKQSTLKRTGIMWGMFSSCMALLIGIEPESKQQKDTGHSRKK